MSILSQVPRDVADAIYGRVQGASYDSKKEWWTVPCGQMLNVTFNFGGKAFPIHPLDTVDNNFGLMDASGNSVCIGAFQPITTAFSILGNYDMIMGMSFSEWTSVNYGCTSHLFQSLHRKIDSRSCGFESLSRSLV